MTRARAQISELLRFGVVGGSAVATDFATYFALVTFLPALPIPASKAIGFVAGSILAFALNRTFVFRSEGAAHRQIAPFAVLYLLSLGLNNGVNTILLAHAAPKLLAWFCATATSTISNFLGMKFIVFRKRKLVAE
jgi:putative flippase GtrA